MSEKKEEVYNILIINNLYINIYFFREKFMEKWQVTSDLLPKTTFTMLIFKELCVLKGHFLRHFREKKSLFNVKQKRTTKVKNGSNC